MCEGGREIGEWKSYYRIYSYYWIQPPTAGCTVTYRQSLTENINPIASKS